MVAATSVGDLAGMLLKRTVLWQYPYSYQDTYGACSPIGLNPGLIISTKPNVISLIGKGSEYSAMCSKQELLPSILNSRLTDAGVEKLPLLSLGWDEYINTEYEFIYTIYPIIYSLSCCTFICGFLSIILFTKQYLRSHKPTMLIKVSTLTAFLYVLAVYIFSIVNLYNQHQHLVSSGDTLLMKIQKSTPFNAIDLVIVILLQLSQVQIILRLFPRRREKRFTFITGLFLSFSSQTIWSVSTFVATSDRLGSDPDYDSSLAILPLLVYLLRIAMSVLFSCLFVVYFFNKRQYVFNPKMLPLTFFTFIIMNSSFGIFIADISNIWVSELSELFNVTAYVVINFVCWEFINRIVLLEKFEQKKGILGRQFYDEEDQYYFDAMGNAIERSKVIKKGKYDLLITSHDKATSSLTGVDTSQLEEGQSYKSVTSKESGGHSSNHPRIIQKWNSITHNIADFTDYLVDMTPGGAIRRASLLSNESLYDTERSKPKFLHGFISKKMFKTVEKPSLPPPSSQNHNVFIYKQKEIKVEPGRRRKLSKKRLRSEFLNNNDIHINYHEPVTLQMDDTGEQDSITIEPDQDEEAREEDIIFDEGSYEFDDDTN